MFNKKKKHWFNQKPNYKKGSINQPDEKSIVNTEADAPSPEPESTPRETPASSEFPEVLEQAAPEQPAPDQEPLQTTAGDVICRICGMPIRNHYTAIRRRVTDELTHFDCVLRELSRENSPKLGKYKRIYYVGSGDFAIVKEFFDKRGHLKGYEIP